MDNEINYEEEYKKLQAEHSKLKLSFDKTSSQCADYKRQIEERMTDEQKKDAEAKAKEEQYKAIQRENAYYKFSQSLSDTIKDRKVLEEVARAYADGDTATAIQKQNEYYVKEKSELEKQIREDILRKQPTPHPDNPDDTPKSWSEMTLDERVKLKRDNPEKYKELKK